MIKTIFELWLDKISAKMSAGEGIDIAKDKVPFGVETVDEIEKARLEEKKQRQIRAQALRDCINSGRICFLLYGGLDGKSMCEALGNEQRCCVANERGQRRMERLVRSMLSNEPKEADYAFIPIPAYAIRVGDGIALDTEYLSKLKGKELEDFIKANMLRVDGHLFGGENILKFAESMFGAELTHEEDGRPVVKDIFAYTLSHLKERLQYI